jgi:hypothetical protein
VAQDQLLLVYLPPEMLKSASPPLISLIEQIALRSPKKIAIQANGPVSRFGALNQLSCSSQLTVGFRKNEIQTYYDSGNKTRFTPGFLDLVQKQASLCTGTTSVSGEEIPIRSFEYEIVKSVSPLTKNLPAGEYGIRYLGGENSIANIRYHELINGNMLRDLIRDKIIVIGPNYPREFHVLTPVSGDAAPMSRLEIRGNMISCLLNESYVTELSFSSVLALLVIVVVGSLQIARQMAKNWLPFAILTNVFTNLLLFVISNWLTSIWLPGTAMMLAGATTMFAVMFQRFTKLDDFVQFWKIRSTTREAHLQSRFEESVWQAVGDSAYQMFQPTRMVMMELEPNATHLKRVCSFGCDYSQIVEKRLDFQRSPYWEAIQNKRPTRSEKREFFVPTPGIKETEYILPLTHGMTTYGVIALAINSNVLDTWADFDSFLNRFCGEMAQLVAGSYWIDQQQVRESHLLQHYRTLPEEKIFAEIQSDSQKLDDLIERVDIAFNSSESAMATFDIYGRVVRRNSNLNLLLQKIDVSISRTDCVNVISTLASIAASDAQKIVRDAILENRSDQRLIANPSTGETSMVMHVKPMRLSDSDARTSIETRGLLLEIVDGQAFQEVRCWKNELSTAMVPEVLRKATQLEQKTAILQNADADDIPLEELFGSVGSTVSEIVTVLESCRQLNDRQITESPENHFLVNTVAVWQSAEKGFQETFLQRSISLTEHFCDSHEMKAYANPILLNRAFTAIIEFLLESAFDESEIRVDLTRQVDGIEFRFTNQGGGTPIDALRKSLDQSPNEKPRTQKSNYVNLDDSQIDRLQHIEDWVKQWNGAFCAKSLPHCITVSLILTTIDVWSNTSTATSSPRLPQPEVKITSAGPSLTPKHQ